MVSAQINFGWNPIAYAFFKRDIRQECKSILLKRRRWFNTQPLFVSKNYFSCCLSCFFFNFFFFFTIPVLLNLTMFGCGSIYDTLIYPHKIIIKKIRCKNVGFIWPKFPRFKTTYRCFRSFCCRRELLCNAGLKFQSSNPRAARQKVTL